MLNSSSNYDKYLSKKRQLTSFEKEGIYLSKSSKNINIINEDESDNNKNHKNDNNDKTDIYVFFNSKYDIPKNSKKEYTFKIQILTGCIPLTIGVCDKELVKINNFEYSNIKKTGNNEINLGIYIFNINKLIWNSNHPKECILIQNNIIKKSKNNIIECTIYL